MPNIVFLESLLHDGARLEVLLRDPRHAKTTRRGVGLRCRWVGLVAAETGGGAGSSPPRRPAD
jgi:hypothetical protein